jgi:NADPH:quinone reductase-like Zn-dependent oxidoreductase
VMGAVIQGCRTIIVVEPHAARRALAMELGATHVIDPTASPDLAAAVRAIEAQGVDYAFDTTGRGDTLTAIMGALAPKGVLGIVGIPAPGTPMPGDLGAVLTLGQTVRGIIEGPRRLHPGADPPLAGGTPAPGEAGSILPVRPDQHGHRRAAPWRLRQGGADPAELAPSLEINPPGEHWWAR